MKKLLCILVFASLIAYANDKMIKNTQITPLSEIECETACECLELLDSQLKNLLNNLSCDSCQIHAFKILEEIAIKNYSYHNLLACDNWFQVDYRFGAILGAGGLSYKLEEYKISKEIITQSTVETPTVEETEKKEKVVKKEEPKEDVIEEKKPEVNKKALYSGGRYSGKQNKENSSAAEIGDGDSNLEVYEGGGIGEDGITYQLGGRKVEHKARPIYNIQVEGKVVVAITVDRLGNVINAYSGIKGSSTLNKQLLQRAKAAALKTKFDTKKSAPNNQQGKIIYNFRLN